MRAAIRSLILAAVAFSCCFALPQTISRNLQGQSTDCKTSLYNPSLPDTAYAYWANDTSYAVTKDTDATTKLDSYYVTGDTILINEDQFPSIARPANAPNTGVATITFDARLIIMDMPLVFDSAMIKLIAEKVIFTNRAAILFNATTPEVGGDGVELITDLLDLSNAKTRPFQFKTDNWEFLSSADQKPWPADRRRRLSISTNKVDSSDPLLKEDPARFFRNLTLDQKYGYAPNGLSSAPYSLHIADDISATKYDESFANVLWPDQFASKVARQFARAPFDPSNTAFLQLNYIRPYSQKLGPSHSSALLELNRIRNAIQLGQDSFGHDKYYVPRTSFDTLLNSFNENLAATVKIINDWDAEVAKGFVGGPVDRNRVAIVRKSLDQSKTDLANAQDVLGKAMTDLAQEEQSIDQQLGVIKAHEDQIEAQLAELIAKDQKNQSLLQVTRVVAVAASLIPASAPVGMIVGQAVLVSGDLVYKHNANEAVTAQGIISVIQTGVEFEGKVRAFRDSWDKLHTAIEKTQDATVQGNDKRAEVNKAFIDASKDFADKGKSVFDLLQVPAPTPLSLNELEKNDTGLQNELQQLANLRTQEGKYLATIKEKEDVVTQSAAAIVTSEQQFYELLRADLRNDNYIVRQRNLALEIRDQFFLDLAYQASTLRRAYAYHTGEPLTAPTEIMFFADDYKALRLDKLTPAEVASTLDQQVQNANNAYEALAKFAKAGERRYWDNRTSPLITVKVYSADSANVDDPQQMGFLDVLNRSIADAALVGKDGTLLNKDPESFYVPFEDFRGTLDLPLKLLHIQVTKVVYENKASMVGKTIELPVAHPGYGFVNDQNGCFYVDMRRTDATLNSVFYGTTLDADGPISLKDVRALYSGTLESLSKYATYPLGSKYFAYLSLKGSPKAKNWGNVPKIKHIEISFYSIQ